MANNSSKDLDAFEASIKQYLDERAKVDELFAVKYGNEKKSIEECCQFIYTVVKKAGRIGWHDDEIFGLAVHYYVEDAPGEIGKDMPNSVVVPGDYITAEEQKAIKEEARREYKAKMMAEYERKAEEMRKRKAETKKVEVEMPSLFCYEGEDEDA